MSIYFGYCNTQHPPTLLPKNQYPENLATLYNLGFIDKLEMSTSINNNKKILRLLQYIKIIKYI